MLSCIVLWTGADQFCNKTRMHEFFDNDLHEVSWDRVVLHLTDSVKISGQEPIRNIFYPTPTKQTQQLDRVKQLRKSAI